MDIVGNTTLIGGATLSTQEAIDRGNNYFNTGGELSLVDLKNKAEFVTVRDDAMKVVLPDGTSSISSYSKAMTPPQALSAPGVKGGVSGAVADTNFAQSTIRSSEIFSYEGVTKYGGLAGRPINTVDDLAAAIWDGTDSVEIGFEALVTVQTDADGLMLEEVELLPVTHNMYFNDIEPDWMSDPDNYYSDSLVGNPATWLHDFLIASYTTPS